MQVTVREMRPDEWADAQEVCVGAFDETGIDVLLTALRSSSGWDASLGAACIVHAVPSYDPSVRGALVYADAFWRADAVGLRE